MEKQVTLICKKQDLTLVQSVIPEAIAIYKRELGLKSEVDVQVSTTEFLPDDIAGGIVASALNGRIRLTNTLDARLDLLSQEVRMK